MPQNILLPDKNRGFGKVRKMSEGMLSKRPHLIPSLIASIMSLLVLPDWPHNFFLPDHRGLVILGFALYVSRTAYKWRKIWVAWIFGFIASLWLLIWFGAFRQLIDIIGLICAVLFVVFGVILRKPAEEKNVPRHLRENFGPLAITGLLAMMFLTFSIRSFVEAKTSQNGGYIPIYHQEDGGAEEIGERWADAEKYTRHLWGMGVVSLLLSVASGGAFLWIIVHREAISNGHYQTNHSLD
jgi:hypothetical protein